MADLAQALLDEAGKLSNKLAVTGGRDTHVSDEDWDWLLSVMAATGSTGLVLGDARGVDREVRDRAREAGIPHTVHVADWDTYGKSAGHIRNGEMLKEDGVVALAAFPGGRGTANCVEQAKKKVLAVFRRQT